MSTFPEYRSWLVIEAAQGFGAATLAAKLLADLGCTVARLEERGARLSMMAGRVATMKAIRTRPCTS
ncbi:MAG: hypothetical protein IPM02_00025 [Betaproteobacteria bacterium]|nr:hypothetical protein [Betaproteobacteria bacterium]